MTQGPKLQPVLEIMATLLCHYDSKLVAVFKIQYCIVIRYATSSGK